MIEQLAFLTTLSFLSFLIGLAFFGEKALVRLAWIALIIFFGGYLILW